MFPGGEWEDAAQKLGLEYKKRSAEYWEQGDKIRQNEHVVTGWLGGVHVYVTTYRGGHGRFDGNDGFSLRSIGRSETARCMRMLAKSDAIPPNLRLVREGAMAKMGQALMGQDIEVGDPAFDSRVQVEGTDLEVVALLDARAREVLGWAIGSGKYKVRTGGVEHERPECISDADRLVEAVQELLHVAQAVCLPADELQARLAHNAANDPLPAVRQRNEALLAQAFGSHAQDPRLSALDDPDPRVALAAAVELGPHGFATIANVAGHPQVDPEVRAEALKQAAMRMPREQSIPLLLHHLSDQGRPLHVAIEALGYLRHHELTEHLSRQAYSADPELLRAILRSLEYMGDPRCEPMLVDLLRHAELEMRLWAIRLLGLLGGEAGAAALAPFAVWETDPTGQADAARQAIYTIRSR